MERRKKRQRGRPKGVKNRDKFKERLKDINPEKAKLIKTIWKLQPEYKELKINLTKFSVKQLKFHLQKTKEKKK